MSTLPPRTMDTMSEAIALSSPSGRMSKRAKIAAQNRLAEKLFGPGGLQPVEPTAEQRRCGRLAQLDTMLCLFRSVYGKKLSSPRSNRVQAEYRSMLEEQERLIAEARA